MRSILNAMVAPEVRGALGERAAHRPELDTWVQRQLTTLKAQLPKKKKAGQCAPDGRLRSVIGSPWPGAVVRLSRHNCNTLSLTACTKRQLPPHAPAQAHIDWPGMGHGSDRAHPRKQHILIAFS